MDHTHTHHSTNILAFPIIHRATRGFRRDSGSHGFCFIARLCGKGFSTSLRFLSLLTNHGCLLLPFSVYLTAGLRRLRITALACTPRCRGKRGDGVEWGWMGNNFRCHRCNLFAGSASFIRPFCNTGQALWSDQQRCRR